MKGYLRLELLRSFRDPRYVVLAIGAPIGFYLLFTTIFAGGEQSGTLSTQVELMVSMAVFGAMWAALSATGPRIAHERSIGWLRQLRLLPLSAYAVAVARLLASIFLVLPAIALVCLTAVVVHDVRLVPWEWAVMILLLWGAALPFALLGVAIGYAADSDSAFGITMGLYLILAALGGLWMPLSLLPHTLQAVGKVLPSYNAADLGWRIAGGGAPRLSSLLNLLCWTIGFSLFAAALYRRASRLP